MVTEAVLSAAVGVVVSLLFSYFPKLNTWFAQKAENYKKLFMLAVLVVISAGVVVLSCVPIGGAPLFSWIGCGRSDLQTFAVTVLMMIVGNQSMYSLTPSTSAVKDAKLEGKLREIYGGDELPMSGRVIQDEEPG